LELLARPKNSVTSSVVTNPFNPGGNKMSTHRVASRYLRHAAFVLLVLTLAAPLFMWSPGFVTLGLRLILNLSFVLWLTSVVIQSPHLTLRPYFLILFCYIVVMVSSALVAPNSFESLQHALTLSSYVQGFILAYALLSIHDHRKLFMKVFWGVTALMVFYGLLQLADINVTPRLSAKAYTLSSFFYHYSHYASYLALIVPLLLSISLEKGKVWYWLFFGTAALNLLLTLSWDTIAFVALVCGVLFLTHWWHKEGRRSRLIQIALLSCLTLSVAAFWLWWARPVPYLETAARFQRLLISKLEGRYAIFEGAFPIIAAQPLLGVGPGNFAYSYTQHKPSTVEFKFFDHYVNHAHSDFVQIAAETGLLGLASYLGFWLWVMLAPAPTWSSGTRWGLRGGLIALFLCGSLEVTMTFVPATSFLAWLLAGALQAPLQQPMHCALNSSSVARRTV
jgi:O-antigen ligase